MDLEDSNSPSCDLIALPLPTRKRCKGLARAECCFLSMMLSTADGHQHPKNI